MSKLSFRARALDASKPLPIYHADDLPDLSDFSTINRTVPQMPTGMEKEEESERHLQDVIQAKQTTAVKKKAVYIPTPEAAIPVEHYDQITRKINRGHQYVRVPGLGLEEVPDYDLDSEDEEWLNAQTNERPLSPTHFERMMDRLEKGSGNTVLSEREAQGLLRDDENLVLAVYDFWLAKRLRLGRSLIPAVKQEGRDGGSGSNPYLAFRKRTEKMQTRKNRKNDETAYMQMLKLKRDLEKAVSLFEWVKEREQKKQELAKLQMDVFKKRFQLEDWSGSILSSLTATSKSGLSRHNSALSDWDRRRLKVDGDYEVHHPDLPGGRKKKRRKTQGYYYQDVHGLSEAPLTPSTPDKAHRDSTHDLSGDRFDDEECDGVFSFKRKPHVRYHSCRDPVGTWPWYSEDTNTPAHTPDQEDMIMDYAPYALLSHTASRERARTTSIRRKYRFSRASLVRGGTGLCRRRVGRGGRVLWDRLTLSELADQSNLPSGSLSHVKPPEEGPEVGRDTGDTMDTLSAHFVPQSPSPSSTLETNSLPFIEHPTDTKPLDATSATFSGISLAFRGIPLTSEFREEAKTFSTLPTSQFFLKSLTPQVDIDYQGSLLSSDSLWGLVPGIKATDPRHKAASEHSTNSPLHSPSPSGNYTNATSSVNNTANDRTQQVAGEQSSSKELSRSSLSVADSKTIVLSNVPLPRPKHQLEKSQRLSSSSDSVQKDASKATTKNINNSTAPSKESTLSATLKQKTIDSSQNKASATKESSEHMKQSEDKGLDKLKNRPSTSSTATPPTTKQNGAHNDSKLSAQSIGTPADYILSFDITPKKPQPKGALQKKSRKVLASLNTATLITTQLGLFQLSKKKDPPNSLQVAQNSLHVPGASGPATPVPAAELISSNGTSNMGVISAVSSLNAAKLAELQSSLVNNTHDKNSTPISEISMATDRRTTASTPLSLATSLANSHVGQALSSVSSAVARRASTGTNGTNYQEIFHTATRRISESAGIKQALAGINHNSLIETANSLVQLGNSSEVT